MQTEGEGSIDKTLILLRICCTWLASESPLKLSHCLPAHSSARPTSPSLPSVSPTLHNFVPPVHSQAQPLPMISPRHPSSASASGPSPGPSAGFLPSLPSDLCPLARPVWPALMQVWPGALMGTTLFYKGVRLGGSGSSVQAPLT